LGKVPDQSGKVFVITGANSGIGLEAAVMLVQKKAKVVMCARSVQKGESARARVVKEAKADESNVVLLTLDVSDLASVREFRAQYEKAMGGPVPIDGLILNAGVMALKTRQESKDGFELQMATNCYGHYLLTAELLDLVRKAPAGRIVSVASGAHWSAPNGGITFDDVDHKKSYDPFSVYAESKLGNILFTKKLARLLVEKNVSNVIAVACHPGITKTPLFRSSNDKSFIGYLGQSPALGATPIVLAATDVNAKNGDYAGPLLWNWIGVPKWDRFVSKNGKDETIQDKFWKVSVEKTSVDIATQLSN